MCGVNGYTYLIMDLSTQVGPFRFKNPVILASGTYGYGPARIISSRTRLTGCPVGQVSRLGGFITKTITLKERTGNIPPRIVETASGIINSVGLENPGIEGFCRNYLKDIDELKTIRIISIGGATSDEIVETIQVLQKHEYKIFDGIEINISCPNIEKGGLCIAQSPRETKKTVQKVRRISRLPIIVKLSPNVTDITAIARAALSAGTDVISLINTISSLAVNWRKRKLMLGGFTGGLSGPAIKPVALKMIYEVATKTKAEIIGIGGIMNAEDVLEFLSVGAKAVQVGTLNLVDPFATFNIPKELKGIMVKERAGSIKNFISTHRVY
ncbi:MAG: dihydroorotate dehydrogenase [Planctomycetota bacterium]